MPGFQGFCFAKQGYSASKMHIGILLRKGRKIYEGFKRICSVLILSKMDFMSTNIFYFVIRNISGENLHWKEKERNEKIKFGLDLGCIGITIC